MCVYTPIQRGVRQGCVLSPLLFNIYTELIFRNFDQLKGTSIGGRNINNLRYVDDTVLVSDTQKDLQTLVTNAKEYSEEAGLSMNVKKTKTMVVSKKDEITTDIKIDNESLEQVFFFKYLGQTITPDARNEHEIKIRIAIAKSRFQQMHKILTAQKTTFSLRYRLLECYVFSVLFYGCETWTLTKVLTQKLEACEMWMLRRMGQISWKARVTNEEVLKRLNISRNLLPKIQSRKLVYFGHIKRHDSIMKDILEGRLEGTRARGRPRAQWSDNIREWAGCGLMECTRLASDRERWRHVSRQPLPRAGTKK